MSKVLIFIVLVVSGCAVQNIRRIIYYTKCDDSEAQSELLRSIDLTKDAMRNSDIELIENQDSVFCGYRLVNGTKTEIITGVMTDYDLALEAERFFDMKLIK